MGSILLLFTIAVVISFFAFREGKGTVKPMDYNSGVFAKSRLMKDKKKYSENTEEYLSASPSIRNDVENEITLVYISSKKYHKKDCRFASKNSNPIKIESAISKGLVPCKICNPKKS